MPTTRAPGARARSKPMPTNTTSASHANDESDDRAKAERRADRSHRSPRAVDAEPQLQATSLPVGDRVLAAPAANPLDAGRDPARRGLQGLEHTAHGRRAQSADAGIPLLHAVRR